MQMAEEEDQVFSSCEKGDIEEVKKWLNEGSLNINESNNRGQTILCIACQNGHFSILNLSKS